MNWRQTDGQQHLHRQQDHPQVIQADDECWREGQTEEGAEEVNIFDGLFGASQGYVIDPRQMRALSQGELEKLAVSNYNAMMNWTPPEYPQRPLDERFADFKVRLAVAIERRRK